MTKTITIFCSARDVDSKYTDEAKKFGKLMVENGYDLVWGGSDKGLMKIMADTVQGAGGKLYGISTKFFESVARPNADEMVVTKDLSKRKELLLARGDAIVLLVGGIGSLDEVCEVIEHKKQGEHHKPVVVLNTDNFYGDLKKQLERMVAEGFIPMTVGELVYFAAHADDAIQYVNAAL